MLTFLPALILLLLHGPANMDGRLARASERADVGSRLPAMSPALARTNRAFLAELLRNFPGVTVLAALADATTSEPGTAASDEKLSIQRTERAQTSKPPATSQRDRDGPSLA